MQHKRLLILKNVCLVITILALLVSCGSDGTVSDDKSYVMRGDKIKFTSHEKKIGDDVPITREEVARTIALSLYTKEEIYSQEEFNFKDVDKESFYYPYINICANKGIMLGDGERFRPESNLTLVEANGLLTKINPDLSKDISVDDENKDKEISYGLWVELFYKTLEELSGNKVAETYGITYTTPVILATPSDNQDLQDYIITENGKLNSKNFDLSNYRDCEVGLYEKNNEILMVKDFVSDTPTIENAYVCEYNNETIRIFTGGVYRDYKVVGGSTEDITGAICDITINGDSAKSININTNISNMKVRKIVGDNITLDDKTYVFDENFKIYGEYGNTLTFENKKDIRVGTSLKFITKEDKVLAGVFEEEVYPKRMRVILNDSSYTNTLHKEVIISSTNGFMVGDKTYGKDEKLIINNDNYKDIFTTEYIEIVPIDNGMLCVESITRANGYKPMYRGTIEVIKVEGGFNVISDVSMEEYLYQVVPSEMPSSYGLEASKVQAICARTYAYKEFYKGGYEKFGANVDDSTNCQVYNNIPETEISIEASEATKNQIITYNDEPIDAFFFSTSGGTTASVGDVWTSNLQNFPATSTEYLTSTVQHNQGDVDLQNEEVAYEFFKSTDIEAPEKDVDWFRWNFTLQKDELSTSINNNIADLYKKRPDLILTKQSDGTFKSVPISSVGLVTDVNIIQRGDGGNVIEIEIIGTENTVRVYTELYIRKILKPYQYIVGREPIVLHMVSGEMENYSLMPSSFFTMDKTYGNSGIESITFYGGGNGHGVGLSQNGANELLKTGMSIEDVIAHYYSGAEIKNISDID